MNRITTTLLVVLTAIAAGCGRTDQAISAPSPASSPASVAPQISLGDIHGCAVIDTEVRCWGNNDFGGLGPTGPEEAETPIRVVGVPPALGVSIGESHTCALLTDGRVTCWGVGGPNRKDPAPAIVEGVRDARDIATGPFHACALISGGTVRCWGDNHFGELGIPPTNKRQGPVIVPGITDAIGVTASMDFGTCVVRQGGRVVCWGGDDPDITGLETGGPTAAPHEIGDLRDVAAIAEGTSLMALTVRTRDGRVLAHNPHGKRSGLASVIDFKSLKGAVKVAVGAPFPCAIVGAEVRCAPSPFGFFGTDAFDEDGNSVDPPSPRMTPVVLNVSEQPIDLAVSMEGFCVLGHRGAIYCDDDGEPRLVPLVKPTSAR
jgi:hypothetical protein